MTSLKPVRVDLAADVLFAVDSAKLTAVAKATVMAAATEINNRSAGGEIEVIGHTDSDGSTSYNKDLSRRRAQAVKVALTPQVTVVGSSYQVEGRGESEPVADNGTAVGRKENRRVSVIFTPKEGK